MRPLPNHLRGSTKLLRELWDALTDVAGRYLPTVELEKVLAVSEIRNPGGEKEEQKDGEKKKDGGTSHRRRRRMALVMRSLAANTKANTSGQVCSDFLNGRCRYGASCIHRHPKDTDDPESADTRE